MGVKERIKQDPALYRDLSFLGILAECLSRQIAAIDGRLDQRAKQKLNELKKSSYAFIKELYNDMDDSTENWLDIHSVYYMEILHQAQVAGDKIKFAAVCRAFNEGLIDLEIENEDQSEDGGSGVSDNVA